jgi:endogenous inhibitor of DNA gyrase (YacG/DUF329 family)
MNDARNCEECGNKLPKEKKGRGRPRRFCNDQCSKKNWDKKHPRVRVAMVAQ